MKLREMQLQIHPDWFPVLRCGFHYHFFGLTLPQPRHKVSPLLRAAAESSAFVLDLLLHAAVDFLLQHRRHHCHQHILVNVDPRYPSRHVFLSTRKWQDAR